MSVFADSGDRAVSDDRAVSEGIPSGEGIPQRGACAFFESRLPAGSSASRNPRLPTSGRAMATRVPFSPVMRMGSLRCRGRRLVAQLV